MTDETSIPEPTYPPQTPYPPQSTYPPQAPVPPHSTYPAQDPAPVIAPVTAAIADPTWTPAPALPPALEVGPSLADLARSVRRHRIWLTVLTVLMILPLLLSCCGTFMIPFAFESLGAFMTIDEDQLDRARDEVKEAYGPRIKELDVRVVTMRYDDMPFSFMSSGMDEELLYVECELKSGVVIADPVSSFYGVENLSDSGIIPTRGSLTSRMTDEQLDAILAAYAAETDAPLGSVRRYSDSADEMYDESYEAPDEVEIGQKTYTSKELWKITEGLIVEGDTVDGDGEAYYSRRGHVFHEDPDTGEFVYLGTESAEVW